jgi:hypothetical protein
MTGKRAVAGSCTGSYHGADRQPLVRHSTTRRPGPRFCAARAGSHAHGIQDTITRPGPHA